MAKGRKTLSIYDDTYYKLIKVGIYGESMDDIIKKLIDCYEKNKKK